MLENELKASESFQSGPFSSDQLLCFWYCANLQTTQDKELDKGHQV